MLGQSSPQPTSTKALRSQRLRRVDRNNKVPASTTHSYIQIHQTQSPPHTDKDMATDGQENGVQDAAAETVQAIAQVEAISAGKMVNTLRVTLQLDLPFSYSHRSSH